MGCACLPSSLPVFSPRSWMKKAYYWVKGGKKNKSSLMNTTASLAVKKARYERLVEVVESKGQPAWGRSWHWGSQLRIWGGSECTGGRAGKQGGIVHTPPPSCARQGKNPISLYLDSKPDRSGTRLALQTPELQDQNCCELGGGHQPHPCAPPAPLPSSLLWVGW